MDYFKKFPLIEYDFTTTEDVKQLMVLSDISTRVQSFYDANSNDNLFSPYTIRNYDTPEKISFNLYGTTSYYWTIMYVNNLFDMFNDWPMTDDELDAYANVLHPGLAPSPMPDDKFGVEVFRFNQGVTTIQCPLISHGSYPINPSLVTIGTFLDFSITDSHTAYVTSVSKTSTDLILTISEPTGIWDNTENDYSYTAFIKPVPKHGSIAYFITQYGVRLDYEEYQARLSDDQTNLETTNSLTKTRQIYALTHLHDMRIENERKRRIKVVKPEYINKFSNLYFNQIIR